MTLMAFALTLLAADPTPADFDAAKRAYDEENARTAKAVTEEYATLRRKYLGKLEVMRQAFASSGNNLRALAVRAEIDRIKALEMGGKAAPASFAWEGNWALTFSGGKPRNYSVAGNRVSGTAVFKVVDGKGFVDFADGTRDVWTPCSDGRVFVERQNVQPESPVQFGVMIRVP